MSDREERNPVKLHPLDPRLGVEDDVEEQMTALMGSQPDHDATQESTDCSSPIHRSWGLVLSSLRGACREIRRNHHKAQQ